MSFSSADPFLGLTRAQQDRSEVRSQVTRTAGRSRRHRLHWAVNSASRRKPVRVRLRGIMGYLCGGSHSDPSRDSRRSSHFSEHPIPAQRKGLQSISTLSFLFVFWNSRCAAPEPGDRDRAGHRGADRPGGRHARDQRARGVGEAAARVLSSRSQAHNERRAQWRLPES